MANTRYQAKLMGVTPVNMVPLNPLVSALILLQARLRGLTARVPPLLGFYGKYYVIQGALAANLTWLAIVVVLFSAISAFYYLRIVAAMYFGEPAGEPARIPSRFFGVGIGLMVLGTLVLGVLSGPILDLARQWYLSL